jgi:hypothetical protein
MDAMTSDAPEASAAHRLRPIIMTGVSGAGKTVVGIALAASLGGPFVDGDDLHTVVINEKMRAGSRSPTRTASPGCASSAGGWRPATASFWRAAR